MSLAEAAFVSDPRRDAHAAIRGFYYQVIVTVHRWLNLPADHELECECGEDIDEVSGGAGPAARVLEQLSHRPELSLRSKKSLEALARFHEHRQRNPDITLSFRFTSPARPIREVGGTFPRGLTGIDAWELHRLGFLTPSERSSFLSALRDLVGTAVRPSSVPIETFSAFATWCSSAADDALTEFVRGFEWGIEAGGCDVAEEGVRALLLAERELTQEAARLQADLLFAHVLRLLTRPGPKRLTRPDLEATLAQRAMPPAAAELLEALRSLVGPLRDTIEATLAVAQDAAATSRRVEETLATMTVAVAGAARVVAPIVIPQPDAPPPAPSLAVERSALSAACYVSVAPRVAWLHGQSGMGKTAAAGSCGRQSPHTVWIQFEHEDAGDAQRDRLAGHLLRLALGTPDGGAFLERYQLGQVEPHELVRRALSSLPAGALVILDNLPLLRPSTRLLALLSMLADSVPGGRVSLLVTSQYRPPASLAVTLVEVPPFSPAETRELLAAAGGPAHVVDGAFVGVFQVATKGNPTLVQALVRYLRSHDWRVDTDTMVAIFGATQLEDVREEVARQLRHTLPAAEQQLLHRLSLVGTPFTAALARAVATATPPIENAVGLLQEALGPWVTRTAPDHYEVSALLAGSGRLYLAPDIAIGVHLAVAQHLLAAATMDQYEAARIAVHLVAGRHWSELAVFLLSVADYIREPHFAHALEFLVHLRPGSTWPADLPAHVSAVLLATQVRLLCAFGQDPTEPLELLDEVARGARIEQVFAPLFLAGPMNQDLDVGLRAARTLAVARVYPTLPEDLRRLPWPIISLFWLGATRISSGAEVSGVLSVLERMTPDERRESFGSELFVDIGTGFLDQLWLLELKRAPGERNWDEVLEIFRNARRIGDLEGSGLLKTLAVRAEATALGQAGRFREAFSTLDDALAGASVAEERLLLHYTATCLSGDREDDVGKLDAAEKALAERPEILPTYRELTRRLAIPAAARLGNLAAAKRLLLQGVGEEHRDVPERLQRELRGELVWLCWSLGQPRRAIGALASLVLSPDLPDDEWAQDFHRKVAFSAKKLEEALALVPLQPPTYPCGLYVTKDSLITDAKGPCPAAAVHYGVGKVAAKAGLPHLAWALLQRARAALRDTSFEWDARSLLLLLVDQLLAGLAARLGRYEQALGYARDCGSDMVDVQARERAAEQPGGVPYPEVNVAEEIGRLLLSYAIAPAIVHTLTQEPTSGAVLRTLDRLQAGVDTLEGTPAVVRVAEVLADLRRAFSPFATVGILARSVQESSPDSGVRPLLALALSLAPGVTSGQAAGYQALGVVELARDARADTGILADLARFVAEYWARRDGTTQAGGRDVVGDSSLARAAALLVQRVQAYRVQLPESLLEDLRSLARDS